MTRPRYFDPLTSGFVNRSQLDDAAIPEITPEQARSAALTVIEYARSRAEAHDFLRMLDLDGAR